LSLIFFASFDVFFKRSSQSWIKFRYFVEVFLFQGVNFYLKKSKPTMAKSFQKKKNSPNLGKPKPHKESENLAAPDVVGMRLNKYVAHCGICSRRQAGELVKGGKIIVNDAVEINPAYQIQENDVVKYEGNIIEPEQRQVYILLNKPKGFVTTLSDEKGRKTVVDLVRSKATERIFPVGRLDLATTGLLLLTNDGDLAKKLTHPSHGVQKVYHVVLDKPVQMEHIEAIRNGLELEDGVAIVDGVDHIRGAGKEEVGLKIHIGKNRIVRRLFEHFGYTVRSLDRTWYAGLTKKDLGRGRSRFLTEKEVIMLKHFS
jgi:23S rRNA pseudouridine2605 synthase